MNVHYEKWDELAPRGLLLTGLGISIIGEAIAAKVKQKGFLRWFALGIIGLIVFNSGLALFGEAVKHRTLYEIEVQRLREKQPTAISP